MRTLIMMRGAPGSGKSTLIRTLGLEHYTLSSDDIRLLYGAPRMDDRGQFVISAHNDSIVWPEFYKVLEHRMKQGELIIVDATHTQGREMNGYLSLAKRYRYRLGCIDLSSIPYEQVLRQNQQRPPLRVVPEAAVKRLYERCAEHSIPHQFRVFRWKEDDSHIQAINDWLSIPIADLSAYKNIHHIGDIQGCATVLKNFLPPTIPEDEFFIFIGDICDRGLENGEALLLLLDLIKKPNVRVLYGNHEHHIEQWCNKEEIRSKEVLERSIPQWIEAGLTPQMLKPFVEKLCDIFVYSYQEKKVLVTHAGLSTVPERLEFLSASTCHEGVGKYSTHIGELFSKQAPLGWYQVHGHRNQFLKDTMSSERSFVLEGGVEFGGDLRILTLDAEGFASIDLPNTKYRSLYDRLKIGDSRIQTYLHADWVQETPPRIPPQRLAQLDNEALIIRKPATSSPSIVAYNFSRDAFFTAQWNDLTTKARGLFIHHPTGEIVARSYDKFFNYEELDSTSEDTLRENLKFPVQVFVKENGFLGILGYNREMDSLFFASKSTPDGDFSACFQRIFEASLTKAAQQYIKRYITDTHSSFVFEVIDPDFDPHIVEYEKPQMILLDVIRRDVEFKALQYKKLRALAEILSIPCKQQAYSFSNWTEYSDWLHEANQKDWQYEGRYIEGFVVEDQNHFQFKIKLEYYQFWKYMRSIKDRVRNIRGSNKSLERDISDQRASDFYTWCLQCPDSFLEQDIITLRKAFLAGYIPQYTPPPTINPNIHGFQTALLNLSKQAYIKPKTATDLLEKALLDEELASILRSSSLLPSLFALASAETKEKWNQKHSHP